MNRYLYFWRLGWVALVVLVICAIGVNLLSRLALFLVSGSFQTIALGGDGAAGRLAIVGVAFLVFGLPYAGWVFDLGMRKASVLVRPPKHEATRMN